MKNIVGIFWVLVMAGLPVGLSLFFPDNDLRLLWAVIAWWLSCGVGQLAFYQIAKMRGLGKDQTQTMGLFGVLLGMVVFPAAIFYPLLHIITIPLTLLALGMAADLRFSPGIARTWEPPKDTKK
jgi:uncharacterized membrane protein YvlD (DUF360 family)